MPRQVLSWSHRLRHPPPLTVAQVRGPSWPPWPQQEAAALPAFVPTSLPTDASPREAGGNPSGQRGAAHHPLGAAKGMWGRRGGKSAAGTDPHPRRAKATAAAPAGARETDGAGPAESTGTQGRQHSDHLSSSEPEGTQLQGRPAGPLQEQRAGGDPSPARRRGQGHTGGRQEQGRSALGVWSVLPQGWEGPALAL